MSDRFAEQNLDLELRLLAVLDREPGRMPGINRLLEAAGIVAGDGALSRAAAVVWQMARDGLVDRVRGADGGEHESVAYWGITDKGRDYLRRHINTEPPDLLATLDRALERAKQMRDGLLPNRGAALRVSELTALIIAASFGRSEIEKRVERAEAADAERERQRYALLDLPYGTVFRSDKTGGIFQRGPGPYEFSVFGGERTFPYDVIAVPVTVLYTPNPEEKIDG